MQETKGMDHVGTERVLCTSGYHLSVQKVGTQMNNDKMCCDNMCAISEGMNKNADGESWTMNDAAVIEGKEGVVRSSR